jgi:hypothetical protein
VGEIGGRADVQNAGSLSVREDGGGKGGRGGECTLNRGKRIDNSSIRPVGRFLHWQWSGIPHCCLRMLCSHKRTQDCMLPFHQQLILV